MINEIVGAMESLTAAHRDREELKHHLTQFGLATDNRPVTDAIIAIYSLRAEVRKLTAALELLKKNGIHADTMPTLAANSQDAALVANFYTYLQRADETVKSIAAQALEG